MYRIKDIQFVGKYDYDKLSAEEFAAKCPSFSVNIFQWELKASGKTMKRKACVVRVSGSSSNKDKVIAKAEEIVNFLDAGKWNGQHRVVVR
jgi:hypothetical protein